MKKSVVVFVLGLFTVACHKESAPAGVNVEHPAKVTDAVAQKLTEYAGASATDCGRLNVQATADRSKTAADCAMQASQAKRPFYVAYDMPGMAIGVAGNADGKLFTVQSQGAGPTAALTSGDCPSQLRVASSGRVTCFAPGDMGSMGAGHTAMPQGMANPTPPAPRTRTPLLPRRNDARLLGNDGSSLTRCLRTGKSAIRREGHEFHSCHTKVR